MRSHSTWLALLGVSLIAALVAGCASSPGPREGSRAAQAARELERQGDYAQAARVYSRLASGAKSPLLQDYQLRAAEDWLRAGNTQEAARLLRSVSLPQRAEHLRPRRDILMGYVAVSEGRTAEALSIADRYAADISLPPATRAAAYDLQAQALSILGQLPGSVISRMSRQSLLRDPQAAWENQNALWNGLMALPQDDLLSWQQRETNSQRRGWLDLAAIARSHTFDRQQMMRQLAAWHARYPGHPASAEALLKEPAVTAELTQLPTRIAILLPLSGNLTSAATAIRDGILAAYYSQPNDQRPTIRVYDTQDEGGNVQRIYQTAVQDGAQFVIGPLTKGSVESLGAAASLPVPTLALNYVGDRGLPANLFQFGLAPEDEARAAAQRAWNDGHRFAVALLPEGEWGTRVGDAFQQRWQQLGGTFLEAQRYRDDTEALRESVQQLLRVDFNLARERAARSATSPQALSQPRRREDADFVFMAAFPRSAREIPPLLKFNYAGALPIYTTSHSYAGTLDPDMLSDMAGVVVCDMPWMLPWENPRPDLERLLANESPETFPQFARLYALGVDSYSLLAELPRLRASPDSTLQGVTGTLFAGGESSVRRRLSCARISRQGLQALDL